MVFTLGFLISGLLTLLFLPAFWRRAVRLSARRLEMQMPLSMAEIVAERDQLRAGFAVEQRVLEQKIETLNESKAHALGELGRRAGAIMDLESKAAALNASLTTTEAQLGERSQQLAAAEAEIGALHQGNWDAAAQSEKQAQLHETLSVQHKALLHLADERRVLVAGLETRAAGLDMRLEDMQRRFEATHQQLQEANLAQGKLFEERDHLRKELASAVSRRDQLQANSTELAQRIAELERAHRAERRARTRFENEVASGARALADAQASHVAATASFTRNSEERSGRESELQQIVEHLKAETSALAGALDVARREFAAARIQWTEAGSAAGLNQEDVTQLRLAISHVGDDILRLGESRADTTSAQNKRVRDLPVRAKRNAARAVADEEKTSREEGSAPQVSGASV
jgi:chromosome segregation ATPase